MRGLIERGRSTTGAPLPYDDKKPWPETAWRKEFTN